MIVTFENQNNQDENWSPGRLSSLIAKRQSSGDDVKCLIAPAPIEVGADDASNQSCTAARHKPSPKNHIKAHRQALRERQRNNKDAASERQAQENMRLQKLAQKKKKLYGKVRSKAFVPTASLVSSQNDRVPPEAAASIDSGPSMPSPFSTESTLNDEHNFHIAFGRKIQISTPASRPNTSAESVASSASRHHNCFGKVPSYITDRKAKIDREEEEQQRLRENAPPAPGLVLMEESERLETLIMLEENEKEAKKALANIPFSMNANRAARLREAIDFRLNEIEDTRKIFSRDKVFVARSED